MVHWGHFPGMPLDQVPEDVRAGTTSGDARLRERYGDRPWYDFYEDDTPIVFGHAVIGPEPLVLRDRVYGLDTGCCHGLRLTALILPERRIVQVPAREDHWASVRAHWQEPVLRTHAWSTMTFDQITKKLRTLRSPELSGGFLDRVEAWALAVRGELPGLAERLDQEVARIGGAPDEFGRAAAAHPAASWLLRHRAGRLSREHLGCASPGQVFDLARALGMELGVAGEP